MIKSKTDPEHTAFLIGLARKGKLNQYVNSHLDEVLLENERGVVGTNFLWEGLPIGDGTRHTSSYRDEARRRVDEGYYRNTMR